MIVVFYDGWCPLCTAVAQRTEKLDRRRKVVFVSFREDETVREYRLSPDLQKRMQHRMYAYDGARWHEGIDAVCKLAQAVPAYWALVPLLKLAVWTGTGQYIYDYVAKRRAIVPTGHCQDGFCGIGSNKGRK